MLPLLASGTYETHQRVNWEVAWFNTSMSVPETGIGFKIGTTLSSFTTSGMQAAADPEVFMEANSTPVFTDSGGAWKFGREALVHDFWEGGAPPGVTESGAVAMHWQGNIASGTTWLSNSEDAWLSFAGNGYVIVEKDGVKILDSELEPDRIVNTPLINSGWSSPLIDIYYWQADKPWGGIVGKYVPKKTDTHTTISNEDHREAPVISASLIPFSTASRVVLPQVIDVNVNVRSPTDFTECVFSVPLKDPLTTIGWQLLSGPRRLLYTESPTQHVLKRGQLIEIRAGFQNEIYDRFRGYIHDFKENSGVIKIVCRSTEAKMSSVQNENYPDRLSYSNFGYFNRTGTSEPIFNIQAYDFWPLEYAIQDLCYKSRLDPKLFYGRRQFTDSVGTVLDKIDKYHNDSVFDSFTDTDSTALESHTANTGQSWTTDTDVITIESNRAELTDDTDQAQIVADVSDRFTLQADLVFDSGSSGSAELNFRGSSTLGSSFLGYRFKVTKTSTTLVDLDLEYEDTGGPITLDSINDFSWPSGTTKRMSVEVDGRSIIAYVADSTSINKQQVLTGAAQKQLDSARIGFGISAIATQFIRFDSFSLFEWKYSRMFQSRSLSDRLIRLQRQAQYGNAGEGFNESSAVDSEYIYRPNISRSTLDWATELADGFAYDFRADAHGNLVLTTRNNPHRSFDVTVDDSVSGTPTDVFNSNAYAGFYEKYTTSFVYRRQVTGSRIDLIAPGKAGLGTVQYTVKLASDGTILAQDTIDLSLIGGTGTFFYDNRFTTDGSNAVVAKLFSGNWGEYIVDITDTAGSEWWLDALLVYDHDTEATILAETLLTSKAVLSLSTSSQGEEARNHVVVIGKRKSALTDSAKTKNPNNPDHEFFVSVGSDPSSIWDDAVDNYIGNKISTVIVDNKVADQDYADWLAQTLLTRQRDPGPSVQFTHTIIPVIEPRDHIRLSDEKFDSVIDSDELWIISYSESYTNHKAVSTIQTTAYKEVPSYEPREDLSLAIIDATFAGNPAINLQISYPSLDDTITITDAAGALPSIFSERVTDTLTIETDGNGEFVDLSNVSSNKWSGHVWPPVPDSISISGDGGGNNSAQFALKNTPYTKFWHIYDYTTTKLHVPFLAGDGTTNYTRDAGNGWNTGGSTNLTISYTGLATGAPQIYSGESPFYDPYTSELADGLLVSIQFDALVSGYYRVSVWDKRHDATDPTPVAWLTEPGVDSEDADAHWSYRTAGLSEFKWDGVDNIGQWNAKQSEHFAWVARGVFELDSKLGIGKGFYAWNDQTTPLVAISDQKSSGKSVFNDDHYSQFYVKIESKADVFRETVNPLRTIRTDRLSLVGAQNSQSEIYVYTHLPPPTQVKISEVEDWDPTLGTWNRLNPSEVGWITTPNSLAANIRNGMPIRVTFDPIARPGERFNSDKNLTSVKLSRIVHLNANILDSFMMLQGVPWFPGTFIEKKRLVNRRLTNSEHTNQFQDTEFRSGTSLTLSTNKWVFEPKDFKIEADGEEQELEYNNYFQIGEDVPAFSINRGRGEETSRFLVGYMNYLFFLSAYTQDRSGRLVWCLNTDFVDKAKILNNTFNAEFPEDLENYSRRTILTRQWHDPAYATALTSEWTIPGANQKLIQFFHDKMDFFPASTDSLDLTVDANGAGVSGDTRTTFDDLHSKNSRDRQESVPPEWVIDRQFGTSDGVTLTNVFGDWTWEGALAVPVPSTSHDPLWIPCPSRDWHPYYLIPPMGLPMFVGGLIGTHAYNVVQHDERNPKDTSTPAEEKFPRDPAFSEVWQSMCNVMFDSSPNHTVRFWPGRDVESFVGDGTGSEQPNSSVFDFTKQQEWLAWEEHRGFITVSEGASSAERGRVLVQPSAGPYYTNTMRYGEIQGTFLSKKFSSPALTVMTVQIDSGVGGMWKWDFKHEYIWESAAFFPTDSNSRIRPGYINMKYSDETTPSTIVFDAGGWVGWKDDLPPGANLVWSHRNLNVGGTGEGDDNIFRKKVPTFALGPQTIESTRLLFSLILLNSRRAAPIAGH